MLKFAIIGFGGLGRLHFRDVEEFSNLAGDLQLVALCDVEESAFTKEVKTNLGGENSALDLSAYRLYQDVEELLEKEELDFVITALPTYIHEKIVVMAMEKGIHVFSEKPMAINLEQAENMLAVSKKNNVKLMIGQCLRFWPAYVALKDAIDSGKYGKVCRAEFTRMSARVDWSWQNWLQDMEKSGGAALDMHVHDVDFINWAFGMPKSVTSFSTSLVTENESMVTRYEYEDMLVTSKVDWELPKNFPFTAEYLVRFEKGTLVLKGGVLTLYTNEGNEVIELPTDNAYSMEVVDFIDCIRKDRESEINPPEASLESLRLALAEIESAKIGKAVIM